MGPLRRPPRSSALVDAARRIQKFEGDSLTSRLAHLEALFRSANRESTAKLSSSQNVGPGLIRAALDLKNVAGQINVLIHAVGILTALPSILEDREVIERLSLGAGNTGRPFDLETNRRIAEFKFIRWRGGPESIRQNSLFKDFYYLAEARTRKARFLYVLGLERPLKFLQGGRDLTSVMSRNNALLEDFRQRYGTRFRIVREYYEYRRSRVQLIDLSAILPALAL